jgi:hypothetical protein
MGTANTAKAVTVLIDEVLQNFEPNNIMSKQVSVVDPAPDDMQNANDEFWRPVPQIAETIAGMELQDSDFTGVLETSVPSYLGEPDNDAVSLNAKDLRDMRYLKRRGKAAAIKLSANINRGVAQLVANTGSLYVPRTGLISKYDDAAECEAIMDAHEINIGMGRSMFYNTKDYTRSAADLANRGTLSPNIPEGAYRRSMVGSEIAGFDLFRANFQGNLLAAAAGAATVAGAQTFKPQATEPVPGANATRNVDNRFANIVINDSSTFKAGDRISFAGVNGVSHINKLDTNEEKTFVVVAVDPAGAANTLQVYPKPVALDDGTLGREERAYANVTTSLADGIAINKLNIQDAGINSFWANDSIELISGHLPVDGEFFDSIKKVIKETTDSGLDLYFAYQSGINNLDLKMRVFTFWGAVNLNPEMNGIMQGGQS